MMSAMRTGSRMHGGRRRSTEDALPPAVHRLADDGQFERHHVPASGDADTRQSAWMNVLWQVQHRREVRRTVRSTVDCAALHQPGVC
jgi:hypothetical protein